MADVVRFVAAGVPVPSTAKSSAATGVVLSDMFGSPLGEHDLLLRVGDRWFGGGMKAVSVWRVAGIFQPVRGSSGCGWSASLREVAAIPESFGPLYDGRSPDKHRQDFNAAGRLKGCLRVGSVSGAVASREPVSGLVALDRYGAGVQFGDVVSFRVSKSGLVKIGSVVGFTGYDSQHCCRPCTPGYAG